MNNWRLSAKCIAHLFKSSYPKDKMQIIFIDNNSDDKTNTLLTYLVEQGEPITYLKQKENIGFVKGNNLGWKTADTPFVMLMNNDAFVDPTCIEKMMNIIKSDEKIGVVGANEFLPDGRESKKKPFVFFKPNGLLDPVLKDLKDLGIENMPEYVDVDIVGSACCIIRKESLKDELLFDERFHPAHYDQESAWMQIKYVNGYKIVLSTKAHFVHCVGATTSLTQESLRYYTEVLFINRKKFLDKWLDFWSKR